MTKKPPQYAIGQTWDERPWADATNHLFVYERRPTTKVRHLSLSKDVSSFLQQFSTYTCFCSSVLLSTFFS